jgi:hypothetical protein
MNPDGTWSEETVEPRYDLEPGAEQADREFFGQSFTILWISPADVDAAVEFLMSQVSQHMELTQRPYTLPMLLDAATTEEASADRFGAWDLLFYWRTYLDRICFFDCENRTVEELGDLYSRVCDDFADALRELPNGPTDWDWERFEELLLK